MLNEKDIADELVCRAERAAFMYYGQPVLRDGGIVLPVLPDWVKGCCSQLFRKATMSCNIKPGATLRYELQRPDVDADVLQLVLFFNAFTERKTLPAGHVTTLTSPPWTQPSCFPLLCLSWRLCTPFARGSVKPPFGGGSKGLGAPPRPLTLGAAGDVERRNLLRAALALHFDCMTDGVIETRTSLKQKVRSRSKQG